MTVRPIALALSFLSFLACADPPTFVLSEETATETAESQPPVSPASESTPESSASESDAATSDAAPTFDEGGGDDGGKGKGKRKD